jgi:hypothetical protein
VAHGAATGDAITDAERTFSFDDLGPRTVKSPDRVVCIPPTPPSTQEICIVKNDYEIELTIDEVPLAFEDTSYLSVHTQCTAPGEVALVGQPLTCATRADNAGPGLPRGVEIKHSVSGAALPTVNSATWSIRPPFGNGTYPCAVTASDVRCQPDSVPVALATPVNVATILTPAAAGLLTGRAEVTTTSTDPDLTDNVATTTLEVFRPVTIDVSPRNTANEVNLHRGSVTVAIITTADFDATTVDPATVCFGDAEAPAERNCAEQHGTGHVEDVNGDKRPDILFHFAVGDTGIDFGDASACVIARTTGGVGLYGCDAVVTKQ